MGERHIVQPGNISKSNGNRRVCFGSYEVDLRAGELRKAGIKIKLHGQPFDLLKVLLERPGEVITREELQQKLWSSDTFVDFERGLNKAINRLRQALGDDASNPRYVETLPRQGYRFIAPAVREEAHAEGVQSEQKQPRRRRWLMWLAATTLIVVATCICAIALVVVGVWHLRSGRTAQIDSIAVLPFINGGGDANTEYLSDGIAESLTDSLTHVPQLKVKSRRSAFQFKGKDVDMQKVGDALGVAALVSGRVVPHGDSIEVSAEITEVRDNTEIWGQHYSSKSTEIISLEQQIAGDIAEKLRSKLSTSEKQQVAKQGTQNPEAYELCLKGRYYWNRRTPSDIQTSISYFNQAIAKDPGYALAYSGLADAYAVMPAWGVGIPSETYPKANAAARRALELDATLARPHAILGSHEMEYEWDFAGGEAEYKKAFELDPSDATVHKWYAEDIGSIGGREQEALAEINRAHQLDPLSRDISRQAGEIRILARQYDEAIAVCKKLANENPTFAGAHDCLAHAYRGKRMYPQVIEEWKVSAQLSGERNASDWASAMEHVFLAAGWSGVLTKQLEMAQPERKVGFSSAHGIATLYAESYGIATLYAELGNKDHAFRWLNTAYQEHSPGLMYLRTDFSLDPIRSDPRFAELVRKVGLPQ